MHIIIEQITNNHVKIMGDSEVVFTELSSCNIEVLIINANSESRFELEIKAADLVCCNGIIDYKKSVKDQLCKLLNQMNAE